MAGFDSNYMSSIISYIAMTGVATPAWGGCSSWAATTTVLVTICAHALGLVIHVVLAIPTVMNETAKESDAIR